MKTNNLDVKIYDVQHLLNRLIKQVNFYITANVMLCFELLT